MIEKFATYIEDKLSVPAARLAEQRHLKAVRDGIIAALPLIIVGSMYMVVAFAPFPENWAIKQFLSANATTILLPYRVTMYIMSLYASWGIGYSLARSYKLDGLVGGTLAAAGFLLTLVPINGDAGLMLPMGNMGGGSMFVAILMSIYAVELYHFTEAKNFKIKMPASVPESVSRSFASITPAAMLMLTVGTVTYYLGFDWHSAISNIVGPMVSVVDTLPSGLFISFLTQGFWWLGIHGGSVVSSVTRPFELAILDSNAAQFAAGQPVTGFLAEPFSQWFRAIGGSGATLALCILMLFFSKSNYLKKLGKACIVPGIFNINEPVMFGLPVVMNPIMLIPFMIVPLVLTAITWFAMATGLVNHVVLMATWTLPGPIGAFLATGNDWRAIVLQVLNLLVAIIIYYPFFVVQDRKMVEEEKALEAELEG